MIQVSKIAQEKLVLALQSNPDYKFIRLGVKGGGCSGLSFSIGLVEEKEPEWQEFPYDNLMIVIDPISMMYLDGVEVDYQETLEASGFKFHNPNASHTCGCGNSFSI